MKKVLLLTVVFLFTVSLFAQNAPAKKEEKKPETVKLLGEKDSKEKIFTVDGMKNPPVEKNLFWIIFASIHVVLFLVFFLRHLKIKRHQKQMQQQQEETAPIGEAQLKNRLAALASEDE